MRTMQCHPPAALWSCPMSVEVPHFTAKHADATHCTTPQAFYAWPAAGVIPIANDSGGPLADIIQDEPMQGRLQPVGYLCSTLQEYADAITDVLCMQQTERLKVAAAARK